MFENTSALPLFAAQLAMLGDAAAKDWSAVEPSIFGTLLTRALDPRERHKLGAEYTPRAYVERLIRPTIIGPLRDEWDAVRVAAATLHGEADLAESQADQVAAEAKAKLAAGASAEAKQLGADAARLRKEADKTDAEAHRDGRSHGRPLPGGAGRSRGEHLHQLGREMSRDDYSHRQKAKDAQYEREYRAWIDSLPPDERRKLEAQGLDEPDVAHHGNGSAKGDAADSPLMREGDDPAVMPEPDPEPAANTCEIEFVWDAVRRVLGEILIHNNSRLTTECIALVSGLSYTGCSETEIARRHGITRAAVSKRCVELTELLGLRPSRAMRSLTARKSYRDARIKSIDTP